MKKLTSDQIRGLWIDYFKSKDHYFLEPKSLIPINDSSLLWINSGVATLKKYFSGNENPPHVNLVNSQKAIRTNDIENVGVTSRHHTFFEMLGNFSIGGYFKKQAIDYAYDLLFNVFNIEKDLLYFTVYEKDEEAYDLWIKKGINASHLFKCNKERNFWDIGQGPCGPCTEIFYDRGEKFDPKNIGIKLLIDDLSNDRYIEIWNIVFSEFNNDGHGNYTELARKNIDTGAGLERLSAISQNVPTDFDSDLFMPIINVIQSLTQQKYEINAYYENNEHKNKINHDFKIIADHLRACVFMIADGAIPSSKDRGSIIRRLFRRSMICLKRLGILDNFVTPIISSVVNTMKGFYPYLVVQQEKIIKILSNECNSFKNTLTIGYDLFNDAIRTNTLDTNTIFKLVDTYGFPFELIQDLASEKQITIDFEAYKSKLVEHQEISRKKTSETAMDMQKKDLMDFTHPSTFLYDTLTLNDAKVIGMFDEKFNKVNHLTQKGWVVFDKTIFYATSGGQQHDEGVIIIKNKKMNVLDVIKMPNRQHLHLIYPNELVIDDGDIATLQVNDLMRKLSSSNHTTEHLLQHALQHLIDKNIKQRGAYKSNRRLTYDYEFTKKLSNEQIDLLEEEINGYIKQDRKVNTEIMSLEEAKKAGAIAYFEDVYVKLGEKLRVVTVDGISKEICGGTHVNKTSAIERFMVVSIDNKGKNMWRIEAITSNETINKFLSWQINDIKKQIELLRSQDDDIAKRFTNIDYNLTSKNYRDLKLKLIKIKEEFETNHHHKQKQLTNEEVIKIKLLDKKLIERKRLYMIKSVNHSTDAIKLALTDLSKEDPKHIYILFNEIFNRTQYFIIMSKSLVEELKVSANQIIKEINKLVSGSGGGNDVFAQGGTTQQINYEKLL